MARPEKVAVVEEIKDKLERSKGVILTDYRGLNVKSLRELRIKLREAEIEYKVVKNTLSALAAEAAGIEELSDLLSGPTALAFGYRDPVTVAKLLSGFAKEHKELAIKGGILGKRVLTENEVKVLATLPGREVLLAQIASAMQSPISGFVNALSSMTRNLVYALDALRRKKEGATEGA